jgi:DNA primase
MYNDRLLFPVFNQYGELLSFQGRAMFDWKQKKSPKYYHGHLEGKAQILYGLNVNAPRLVSPRDTYSVHKYDDRSLSLRSDKLASNIFNNTHDLVVTEGPFDVVALYQCGIPAVALLGTSFSEDQAALIRRYTKNVRIWLDQDKAGRAATINMLNLLDKGDFTVKVVGEHGEYKDASDMYVEKGRDAVLEYLYD